MIEIVTIIMVYIITQIDIIIIVTTTLYSTLSYISMNLFIYFLGSLSQ